METISTLSRTEAADLDADLMGDSIGYSLEQLMELAGLAVAQAVAAVFGSDKCRSVRVAIGPGNNGGDGIVAARHLKLFGYTDVEIAIPKLGGHAHFQRLIKQAQTSGVTISFSEQFINDCKGAIFIDALFGFSGRSGIPKPPFEAIFNTLALCHQSGGSLVCVDVPSGWDVDNGPIKEQSVNLRPDLLVSLSAPKRCSLYLDRSCRHFVGGNFIPRYNNLLLDRGQRVHFRVLAEKYRMLLPPYGDHGVFEITY